MYLVRTIQRKEQAEWVDGLKRIPLPGVPRRDFAQVLLVHRTRVLEFDVERVEEVETPENVKVGTDKKGVIRARSYIHFGSGPKRIGRSKVRGFNGIRYADRWSDVAE